MFNIMSRRGFIGHASAALAATALSATTSRSASLPSLALGMGTWVGYCPVYIAIAKGFYEEAGVALELTTFSGNDAAPAFAAGRIDMTSTAGSSALTLVANGVAFKNFLIPDFSVGADGILARNSVKDVADFKGKRIAVELVAVSHFLLLQVLDKAGLKEEDVTLINLAPDVAAAAYKAGEVDIAVTYAPYLGQVNKEVPDGRIIFDTSAMPTAIVDYYQVRDDVLAAKPEAVRAFVKGTFKGLEFLQSHAAEALAICAKAMSVPADSVAADLKGVHLPSAEENVAAMTDPESPYYVIDKMRALADFLREKGQIGEVPDLTRFYDASLVKAVL